MNRVAWGVLPAVLLLAGAGAPDAAAQGRGPVDVMRRIPDERFRNVCMAAMYGPEGWDTDQDAFLSPEEAAAVGAARAGMAGAAPS